MVNFCLDRFSDVDECSSGRSDCGSYATCYNTPGSFKCKCKGGYGGMGQDCKRKHPTLLVPMPTGETDGPLISHFILSLSLFIPFIIFLSFFFSFLSLPLFLSLSIAFFRFLCPPHVVKKKWRGVVQDAVRAVAGRWQTGYPHLRTQSVENLYCVSLVHHVGQPLQLSNMINQRDALIDQFPLEMTCVMFQGKQHTRVSFLLMTLSRLSSDSNVFFRWWMLVFPASLS